MRKALTAVALILGAAGLLFWLWPADDPGAAPADDGRPSTRAPASTAAAPAPERMNAILTQPLRAQTGDGVVRGRVVSAGQPVGGATVTATRSDHEALSELDCHCDNACGRKLLECGCGEASEQLKALVAERGGEVVPVGRTLTAADGTFALSHLDPGLVSLWADSRALGTALSQNVAVGGGAVVIELGAGVKLTGTVTIDGTPAPANAWVTAIHGEQSRFFDVLTGAGGTFAIGPLPIGIYSLVAGAPGALSGHEHLRKDAATTKLEIALFTPRAATGRVELDGKPIAGVAVKLDGNHRKSEATTAPDGTFRFADLRPGKYELLVLKGSLRADATVRVPAKGDPAPALLTLAEGARVAGTVRGPDGPVAGAQVTVYSLGREAAAKTGADGAFELNAFPSRGANLRTAADGFIDDRQSIDLVGGEVARVAVTLVPEVTIAGAVVDEAGAPIAGAGVSAARDAPRPAPDEDDDEGVEDPVGTVFATSGDAGTFVLKKMAAGDYLVTATHEDFVSASSRAPAPSAGVRLTLSAGLVLTGETVTEAGAPVAARVSAWGLASHDSRQATADTAGSFRLKGLVEGKYQLTATSPDGSTTEEVFVSGRKQNPVRLVLQAFTRITGRVIDTGGNPVPLVRIAAWSATGASGHATSTEDGTFELLKLRAGEYEVSIIGPEYESPGVRKVRAGTTGLEFVLKPKASARGRVVDTRGVPLTEFSINAQRFANSEGTFTLPLGRSPELELTAAAPGYLGVKKRVRADGRDVDVGDIVLGGRELRVRALIAETGQPLTGADVWELSAWKEARARPTALTGNDGWATLRGLPLSNAVVVVNHPTHASVRVPIADTDTEKVVQVPKGATLIVRLVDAAGKPAAGEVGVQGADRGLPAVMPTDKAGVARFEGMSAGKWSLTASAGRQLKGQATTELPHSGEVTVPITLVAGQVDLTLTIENPSADWAATFVMLLPGTMKAPASSSDLVALRSPLGVEGRSGDKPGLVVIHGVAAGPYTALVVIADSARRMSFFTALIEVTAQPKQALTLPAPATLLPIDN